MSNPEPVLSPVLFNGQYYHETSGGYYDTNAHAPFNFDRADYPHHWNHLAS